MFVFTVKAQNIKFAASLFVALLAIVLTVTLFPKGNEIAVVGGIVITDRDLKGIDTNEKRIELLGKYGRLVEAEPHEIKEVTIPNIFDATYKKYNELQKTEGFDLSKYKGKTVRKYTYIVTNEKNDGTVFATLLIYKEKVIGGDISSADPGGFIKGFSPDNDFTY